jgi:hypothetical protein
MGLAWSDLRADCAACSTPPSVQKFIRQLSGTLHAIMEAARGLPDLLKARREAMEARWKATAVARMGG